MKSPSELPFWVPLPLPVLGGVLASWIPLSVPVMAGLVGGVAAYLSLKSLLDRPPAETT
jgi:hypothetical protein